MKARSLWGFFWLLKTDLRLWQDRILCKCVDLKIIMHRVNSQESHALIVAVYWYKIHDSDYRSTYILKHVITGHVWGSLS